jgi:hypothetical protein
MATFTQDAAFGFATVQTTDATATTLRTESVTDDSLKFCVLRVAARALNGDSAVWVIEGGAKRDGGGGVSLVGGYFHQRRLADTDHNPWSVVVKASGNNLVVEVKGQASTTIDWCVQGRVTEIFE